MEAMNNNFFSRMNLPAALALIILCTIGFFSCEKMILGPDAENTPQGNFEILWKDFDRYYALFDVKRVDWNAVYAQYRPQIHARTTTDELWTIFTQMLKELNDPHTTIWDPNTNRSFTSGFIEGRRMEDFNLSVVAGNYLNGQYRVAANGRMVYGRIPAHSIGYIYIGTFGDDENWPKEIDGIVQELSDVQAMIIDIRANPGGVRHNSRYLAATFTDRSFDYFYTQARNGQGHSDFEPLILLSLEPRAVKWDSARHIALLTNRFSGSSSDHFTWMLKYHLPYVAQIGDTTVGNFGDVVHWRILPNGWSYKFSAMRVTTPDGVAPDSLNGIVPNVLVRNSKADIAANRDRVLEYAISYLGD